MKTRNAGIFRLSLKAIKLQLATLMDEAGGEQAIELMDVLSDLNPAKRDIIIKSFIETVEKLSEKDPSLRLDSTALEDQLFNEIVEDIEKTNQVEKKFQLEIVNTVHKSAGAEVISLDAYRGSKKH